MNDVSMTKTNIAAASRIPSRGVPPPPSGVPIQRGFYLGADRPCRRAIGQTSEGLVAPESGRAREAFSGPGGSHLRSRVRSCPMPRDRVNADVVVSDRDALNGGPLSARPHLSYSGRRAGAAPCHWAWSPPSGECARGSTRRSTCGRTPAPQAVLRSLFRAGFHRQGDRVLLKSDRRQVSGDCKKGCRQKLS
jgi:hypothetical protein